MTTPTILNPRLRELYACWQDRRAGCRLPSRGDFDPIDLRFILGNLILVDVLPGTPPDFRIRLHGSNLVARHGYELTGRMLDELPLAEQRGRARRSFTTVAATGQPLHGQRDRLFDGTVWWERYETVVLPLSSSGTRPDMLLVGLVHADEK